MNIQDYYECSGSGEPILFIHGSFASHATWRKIIDHLKDDFCCVAIKLPGHGGVAEPEDFANPTMDTELNIIRSVMESVWGDANKPVHLVGHSYGGVVALTLAVTEKLRVKSLTLFEPVAGNIFKLVNDGEMKAEMAAFLERYCAAANAGDVDTCGLVIDFWGGEGSFAALPEPVKAAMRNLVRNNLRHWALCSEPQYSLENLKDFTAPTMLVNGSQSNVMAHRICECLAGFLISNEQYEIDGASHFMVNTHVARCVEIVRKNVVNS